MVSKRWTPRNHAMGGLFVFLLLALFALTCLVTVLLSVQGYLGIQADVDQCASQRVLAGYLRGKVRSSDLAGGVALRQEDGRTVLCLRQGDWETRVYAAGGALWEQLCEVGEPFDPELGERIAEVTDMRGTLSDHRLCLEMTQASGETLTLTLALRSGEVSP